MNIANRVPINKQAAMIVSQSANMLPVVLNAHDLHEYRQALKREALQLSQRLGLQKPTLKHAKQFKPLSAEEAQLCNRLIVARKALDRLKQEVCKKVAQ